MGAAGGFRKINWLQYGVIHLAGVDEAGRGCLAGPVFAAAVILRPENRFRKLTDSKLLTPQERDRFAKRIKSDALCWAVGQSSVEEIETLNILHASLLAMKRAVEQLPIRPELVLIDGNQKMKGDWNQLAIVKGDLLCLPISAASVLAKTS